MLAADLLQFPTAAKEYEMVEMLRVEEGVKTWHARCPRLGAEFAIKAVDLELSEAVFPAMQKDVAVMRVTAHPNVVHLNTAFVIEHSLWLVMDYMNRGSCLDQLRAKYTQGFSEPALQYILRQALDALVYLHEEDVIHRDVKAANLLVDSDWHVKLGEFRLTSVGIDQHKTKANTYVGTPCWMAPEVVEQEESYDSKADIWSLGITAIELARGKTPFFGMSPLKVLKSILQKPPPRLQGDFSPEFKSLVAQCLQRDSRKRSSAADLTTLDWVKSAKRPEDCELVPIETELINTDDGLLRVASSSSTIKEEAWVFDNMEELFTMPEDMLNRSIEELAQQHPPSMGGSSRDLGGFADNNDDDGIMSRTQSMGKSSRMAVEALKALKLQASKLPDVTEGQAQPKEVKAALPEVAEVRAQPKEAPKEAQPKEPLAKEAQAKGAPIPLTAPMSNGTEKPADKPAEELAEELDFPSLDFKVAALKGMVMSPSTSPLAALSGSKTPRSGSGSPIAGHNGRRISLPTDCIASPMQQPLAQQLLQSASSPRRRSHDDVWEELEKMLGSPEPVLSPFKHSLGQPRIMSHIEEISIEAPAKQGTTPKGKVPSNGAHRMLSLNVSEEAEWLHRSPSVRSPADDEHDSASMRAHMPSQPNSNNSVLSVSLCSTTTLSSAQIDHSEREAAAAHANGDPAARRSAVKSPERLCDSTATTTSPPRGAGEAATSAPAAAVGTPPAVPAGDKKPPVGIPPAAAARTKASPPNKSSPGLAPGEAPAQPGLQKMDSGSSLESASPTAREGLVRVGSKKNFVIKDIEPAIRVLNGGNSSLPSSTVSSPLPHSPRDRRNSRPHLDNSPEAVHAHTNGHGHSPTNSSAAEAQAGAARPAPRPNNNSGPSAGSKPTSSASGGVGVGKPVAWPGARVGSAETNAHQGLTHQSSFNSSSGSAHGSQAGGGGHAPGQSQGSTSAWGGALGGAGEGGEQQRKKERFVIKDAPSASGAPPIATTPIGTVGLANVSNSTTPMSHNSAAIASWTANGMGSNTTTPALGPRQTSTLTSNQMQAFESFSRAGSAHSQNSANGNNNAGASNNGAGAATIGGTPCCVSVGDAQRMRGDASRLIGDMCQKMEDLIRENERLRKEQSELRAKNSALNNKLNALKTAMNEPD